VCSPRIEPSSRGLYGVGMPVTKAQALTPGLIIKDADPAADAKRRTPRLWALQTYAPIVAPDQHDGIVIDVTGAAHFHGGEDAMLKGMVERNATAGIAARAALAGSWGAAHALARFAARPAIIIIPPGKKARKHPGSADRRPALPKDMVDGLSRPRF